MTPLFLLCCEFMRTLPCKMAQHQASQKSCLLGLGRAWGGVWIKPSFSACSAFLSCPCTAIPHRCTPVSRVSSRIGNGRTADGPLAHNMYTACTAQSVRCRASWWQSNTSAQTASSHCMHCTVRCGPLPAPAARRRRHARAGSRRECLPPAALLPPRPFRSLQAQSLPC